MVILNFLLDLLELRTWPGFPDFSVSVSILNSFRSLIETLGIMLFSCNLKDGTTPTYIASATYNMKVIPRSFRVRRIRHVTISG